MPKRSNEERVEHRISVWSSWLDRSVEAVNGWWTGFCPLHDSKREEPGSAEFNFTNGTFRCTKTPRCHHRAGMSLSQLSDEVVKRLG